MIPAGASVVWLILAVSFMVISGIFAVVNWKNKRNAEYEKIKKEIDDSIDDDDWDKLDDAQRKLRE